MNICFVPNHHIISIQVTLCLYTSVEHPTKEHLATLLEPGHLEPHQASPEGAAKRLWMEGW